MPYKLIAILVVVQLLGCTDRQDKIDGIKINKVTYTIEDEDTSHRVIRRSYISPYSLGQYYAYLFQRVDYSLYYNITTYNMYLRDNLSDREYIIIIKVGGNGLQYKTYQLITSESPDTPDKVFVVFKEKFGDFDQYWVEPSLPYKFEYSMLNSTYDILTISYQNTYGGSPRCNFNGVFYIKKE